MQGLQSDASQAAGRVKALQAELAASKSSHSKELSATQSELESAQRNISSQQQKLEQFQAMLHSEHVNSDNWKATLEQLQSKIKTLCAPRHIQPWQAVRIFQNCTLHYIVRSTLLV